MLDVLNNFMKNLFTVKLLLSPSANQLMNMRGRKKASAKLWYNELAQRCPWFGSTHWLGWVRLTVPKVLYFMGIVLN